MNNIRIVSCDVRGKLARVYHRLFVSKLHKLSVEKRNEYLKKRDIKADRTDGYDSVTVGHNVTVKGIVVGMGDVGDSSVGEHNALGSACRSRRVYDISHVFLLYKRQFYRIIEKFNKSVDFKIIVFFRRFHVARGDKICGFAVFHNVGNSVLRVRGVHGNKRRTRLGNSEDCGNDAPVAIQHKRNRISLFHARLDKSSRDSVTDAVKLGKRERHLARIKRVTITVLFGYVSEDRRNGKVITDFVAYSADIYIFFVFSFSKNRDVFNFNILYALVYDCAYRVKEVLCASFGINFLAAIKANIKSTVFVVKNIVR